MSKIYMDLYGGAKMPAVGLGTFEAKEESELTRALDTALELGYRHIDTALVYENEVLIGKILKKWFDSGKIKREDLFITTKLPMFGVHPDKVEEFMKISLKNLDLDYVDLYLIHFPACVKLSSDNIFGDSENIPTDHVAVWKKMEEQVDAGRAKAIGISNFNKSQIAKLLKSNPRIKPANLQVEVHVYLQQQELVKFCLENGITVTAYAPLGSPEMDKFLVSIGKEPKNLPNMLTDETINKIAKKHNKTSAQVMLRYLLQRSIVVIPKSVIPSELKQNIDIFDFALDNVDMKTLNGLEVGEPARVCDFSLFTGLDKHPQWPFSK